MYYEKVMIGRSKYTAITLGRSTSDKKRSGHWTEDILIIICADRVRPFVYENDMMTIKLINNIFVNEYKT